MSHFYGSIDQSARKTTATARGHKTTGLSVKAASWNGAVTVTLSYDTETGQDIFIVEQVPHGGHGVRQVITEGVVGVAL